nr:ABC transporter substrate-binding protein [Cypionkella sp.]
MGGLDDGLTYTFKLRDAKFSDGSPVTTEDVAYSLTRIRDSELSLWSDRYKIIGDMQTPDAKTLIVTLTGLSAPFLSTLAMSGASIVSKAAMEAMGQEAFAEKPVGSGAFMVEDWRRGDPVILKKNPEYWDAATVSLDGVEWISIRDDNTRMLAVQPGELDAAIYVPFSRVAELKADVRPRHCWPKLMSARSRSTPLWMQAIRRSSRSPFSFSSNLQVWASR